MIKHDYAGLNNFVWWTGVVEDINDPLKAGRVRVRILGWHTEDKSSAGIPTQHLPWSQVLMPVVSPAMSGIGMSPTGILQGSWVMGFFLDGENAQQPFVIGTYAGVQKPDLLSRYNQEVENTEESVSVNPMEDTPYGLPKIPYNDLDTPKRSNRVMDYTIGFRDPNGIYPIEGRMNEPDTNRLVRNENIEWTIVQNKKDRVVSCNTALYGSWKEPETPYAAVYPKNHVTESESGHIIEIDDTPGHERLHTYHKSGTFTEIHPKGSEVHKVVGNAWDITLNDKMIYVKGNASFNTDKTLKIKMGKHIEIEAEGDMRVLVKGNTVMETKGNFIHKVKGTLTMVSEKTMTFIAPRIELNPKGSAAENVKTILTNLRAAVLKVFDKKKAKTSVAPPAPFVGPPAPPPPPPVPVTPPSSPAAAQPPVNATGVLAGKTYSAVDLLKINKANAESRVAATEERGGIMYSQARSRLELIDDALKAAEIKEARGNPVPVKQTPNSVGVNFRGVNFELTG